MLNYLNMLDNEKAEFIDFVRKSKLVKTFTLPVTNIWFYSWLMTYLTWDPARPQNEAKSLVEWTLRMWLTTHQPCNRILYLWRKTRCTFQSHTTTRHGAWSSSSAYTLPVPPSSSSSGSPRVVSTAETDLSEVTTGGNLRYPRRMATDQAVDVAAHDCMSSLRDNNTRVHMCCLLVVAVLDICLEASPDCSIDSGCRILLPVRFYRPQQCYLFWSS